MKLSRTGQMEDHPYRLLRDMQGRCSQASCVDAKSYWAFVSAMVSLTSGKSWDRSPSYYPRTHLKPVTSKDSRNAEYNERTWRSEQSCVDIII
jgi:hypothetical protein